MELSRKDRKRLETIHRRITFLENRIANYKGANPSRDIAEAAALRWVCQVADLPVPPRDSRQIQGM